MHFQLSKVQFLLSFFILLPSRRGLHLIVPSNFHFLPTKRINFPRGLSEADWEVNIFRWQYRDTGHTLLCSHGFASGGQKLGNTTLQLFMFSSCAHVRGCFHLMVAKCSPGRVVPELDFTKGGD